MNKIELKGQKIGRLMVIEECGKDKHRNILWRCKCDCYYEKPYKRPVYGRYTGRIEYYEEQMIGYCYGTKECEQCDCNGDESKCTFYAEFRERAKTDNVKISGAEELKLLKQFIKEHDMVLEFEDWVNKIIKE